MRDETPSWDRWVSSLDDFTDEEFLRREASAARRRGQVDEAIRLGTIAERLASLRALTA